VPPSPPAAFAVGRFSHNNQPVQAAITEVKLRVDADIAVDGMAVGSRTFFVKFEHEETPNIADPCEYGGANGSGVSVNGCADRVAVSFLDTSQSFDAGGETYTINLIGFEVGGAFASQFLTAERALNEATLLARVTARRDLNVPEPGGLALAGLGLLAAGVAGRRRQA
jgi:hypothetical protein